VHRDRLDLLSAAGPLSLSPGHGAPTGTFAVGDWVLTDASRHVRRLDRRSLLARRAAGSGAGEQLIAANVDTLFVTTSCNADFNPARIERYLALAAEAGTEAVIVLTKADLAAGDRNHARMAERLARGVVAVELDARDPGAAEQLAPWCKAGRTVALLGSSGVGKTTLANTLTGRQDDTAAIREDDAKGRHTTTFRALRPLSAGGWLIDTPGMRELRLADVADGIDAVFDDVTELAARCRFRDCAHEAEPGCAVRAAIEEGRLDPGPMSETPAYQVLARKYRPQTFADLDRARGDGAHAEERLRGRPDRACLRDDRRARGGQDHHGADHRQGAELRRAGRQGRADDRALRHSASPASPSPKAAMST
jgi:ribosome biogenesis GTPase / thiamine phosphate phosphatase